MHMLEGTYHCTQIPTQWTAAQALMAQAHGRRRRGEGDEGDTSPRLRILGPTGNLDFEDFLTFQNIRSFKIFKIK